MRNILITGVTGFIGRYTARLFTDSGWNVVGLGTRPPENAPRQYLYRYYQLTLPSPDLTAIIQEVQPEVCIHCAGRASVELSTIDPGADFSTNVLITFELLNTLRLYAPQCRLLYLSSAAVYGNPASLPIQESQSPNPISPYGFHKLTGENLCLEFTKVYGLPTASLRIFSAYGPGLRRQVLWDICQKIITQNALKLRGTGNESRDFIHALDVAKTLSVLATSAPMQGEVYNIGTGQEVTISSLTKIVLDTLSYDCQPEFDGIVPVGIPSNWRADVSKLHDLGFTASVPLEQGVKTFAYWCRAELIGV
jgi:UDP-glucose 4-epimerase